MKKLALFSYFIKENLGDHIGSSYVPSAAAQAGMIPNSQPEQNFQQQYAQSMSQLNSMMAEMDNIYNQPQPQQGYNQQYYNPYQYNSYNPQYNYNTMARPSYPESYSNPVPEQPAYNPAAEPVSYGEGSSGSSYNIDLGNVNGVQVDCWANITDRINFFFKDKFPKLPSGESAYTNIEILNCYGCWCNREQFFGRGMGEPKDSFDTICKFHHQAYECIIIDAEDRGEVCDPTAVSAEGFKFKMELTFENGRGGMNLQCDQNQSWCKQRVCEADLQYIKDFVRTALAGHRVRRDLYGHDDHIGPDGMPTGYFDHQANCPLGGSLHTPYKQCCGAYPRRRTYKTDALTGVSYRECCDLEEGDNTGATDGAVYYPDHQICCGKHGIQSGDQCTLYDMLL